jgi:hypothetical protein
MKPKLQSFLARMNLLILITSGAALGTGTALADTAVDPHLDALANQTASAIPAQFRALLAPLSSASAPTDCANPEQVAAYARALAAKASFEDCRRIALLCQDSLLEESDEALSVAATCSETLFDFKGAYHLHDLATSARFVHSPRFAGHVFSFATFAEGSDYTSQTLSLLKRNPEWADEAKAAQVLSVIDYLATGDAKTHSSGELDAWIENRIHDSDATLKAALITAWANHLLKHLYQYLPAVEFLAAHLSELNNPHRWFSVAYQGYYNQDLANFKLARRIYDSYAPFANTRSWLPMEQNVFTYSELYASACHDHLLQ